MTIFEYLMVLVSIIMGLGMTQVLRGASRIARSKKRYSAVTIFTLLLFYLYVQNWWAMWDLNEVVEWNQVYFSLIIIMVCSLFAATELLLPMAASAETDWEQHYFSVRTWFYGTMVFFGVLATLQSRWLVDFSLMHPYRVIQAIIISIWIVGVFVSRPRWQPWIAGTSLGVLIAGQAIFRLLPGVA